MQNQTTMGMNRTGSQMSPVDVKTMAEFADSMLPGESDVTMDEMRGLAFTEADAVGSVPVPGTMKGALQKGAAMLKGQKAEVLLDKLGERLAFERSGARLYEAMIAKCDQANPADVRVLDTLRHIGAEEREHFAMLKVAIESLGADPTAQTPCADVSAVMSMGILQVVTDPRTNVAQCLEAILVAELADNASWEMLIRLARQMGKDDLVPDFQKAFSQEQEHLVKIKALVEEALNAQVQGSA